MNFKAALKQIREGNTNPVYVCYGKEKFQMQQFISELIKYSVEPEHQELAVEKYDLRETSIDQVLEDVQTLPFMVPRKIVIASHALFLTGVKISAKEGRVEHDLERLIDYLQHPVDYAVLIITVHEDKLDERKKVVKRLKEMATALSFAKLAGHDLSIWISSRAKQAGCQMDQAAIDSLIMNVGDHLETLDSEIEKLSIHIGSEGKITPQIIEQLVARSTEQSVFKLVDEIVALRLDKALSIYYDLLEQREEPIKILFLIVRQFRLMLQVKELSSRGMPQQQIASQLKQRPFSVKIAEQQGKRFTEKKLSDILSQLAELDYQIKSGQMEKVLGLELFILKLSA